MNIHKLKKAPNYKVKEWIYNSIPELTAYQKQKIVENEIIRWAPFEFFEDRKKVNNVFFEDNNYNNSICLDFAFYCIAF